MVNSKKIRRRLRDETGGATVEFVISMLVIVPVFLYGALLQDILMGRLDLQESVTGAAWDFSAYYRLDPNARGSGVGGLNRLTWCNHTSMFDSLGSYDCTGEDHHAELGAHICWLGPGAEQVQCEMDSGVASPSGILERRFHNRFNEGGMATCRGSISFLNRLVPGEFFTQWTEVDLAPSDQHELGVRMETGAGGEIECDPNEDEDCESVHQSARDAGDGSAVTLRENRFSILADPWHVPRARTYRPGQSASANDTVYARVDWLYSNNSAYPLFWLYSLSFFATALQEELISPLHPLIQGDNPATPNVSEQVGGRQSISQPGGTRTYYTTPWKPGDYERYSETYGERGEFYMGKTESPYR